MMLDAWLENRRTAANLEVEPLDWAENREWSFSDGVLRHATGGFFSIRGVELQADDHPLDGLQFPMIDQPEIGVLGFLVHRAASGPRWLLQAKAEPGTTGVVQIGPSVQATHSNYSRLHGGAATAYLDEVMDAEAPCPSRVLQSEQGSRFLDKYNLNVVRILSEPIAACGPGWLWVEAVDLRQALGEDFKVNTDARSVVATSDWALLCADGVVFAPRGDDKDAWRALFRTSLAQETGDVGLILERLGRRHAADFFRLHHRPVDRLEGWHVVGDGIVPDDDGFDFEVRSYAVRADCRELAAWHQPLLRSLKPQRSIMFFARREGVLKAFLADAREPGFGRRVQFGPSWQSDRLNPAWTVARTCSGDGTLLAGINQSDEGGRFMQSVMRYELRWLDATGAEDEHSDGVWVTLAQLQALSATGGALTNEARSAISLLLAFG